MNNLFMFTISPTAYYIICAVLSLVILLGIYLMSKVETSVLVFLSAFPINWYYRNIYNV